jgi:hypothetical protein
MNIEILTYGRTFIKIKHVPEHYKCKFLFKSFLVFVLESLLIWKVLNCAAEGWRRPGGRIV